MASTSTMSVLSIPAAFRIAKTFRQASQTLILGLGAYLAIERQISPGIVIAGSILLGRALAPIDQLIGSWRAFLGARGAYQRLDELLAADVDSTEPMPLPAPRGELTLESLMIRPPGAAAAILSDVNLRIEAGTVLAVIGPSAAGKSTLVRAILGLYPPAAGSVRLDGASLDQWDRAALGPHIGYLPQDVELLDGSVSENIARFGEVDPDAVVAAARAAGVHEMILRLPEGYETRVMGRVLSAGQRQRIGLARALYGDPKLIVLDEPNSNLDKDGDAALARTLEELRGSGRTIILVTHRSNLLAHVDKVLLLNEGRVVAFGDRDPVLASLKEQRRPPLAVAAHPAAAARAGAEGDATP